MRRRSTLVAMALALVAFAGCDSDPGATQTTGEPRRLDRRSSAPGAPDPCKLLTAAEVDEHGGPPADRQDRARGISIKDGRVVECRLNSVSGDSLNVGYVARDPGELSELVPDSAVAGPEPPGDFEINVARKRISGVGDEAYIAKSAGLWTIAASRGKAQMLLTYGDTPQAPVRREQVIDLAKLATDRLPRSVDPAVRVLPRDCRVLAAKALDGALTKVALARGSEVERGLVCDYTGTGGTRLRSYVEQLEPSNIDALARADAKSASERELGGFGQDAKVFYDAETPAYSAYVDRRYLIELDLTALVGGADHRTGRRVSRRDGDAILRGLIAAAKRR